MAKKDESHDGSDDNSNRPSTSSGGGTRVINQEVDGPARGFSPANLLPNLSIHIRHQTPEAQLEETQMEGRELFVEFFNNQCQSEHVQVPHEIDEVIHQQDAAQDRHLGQVGNTLRHLADEFAKSKGRDLVRQEADKALARIESISYEEFQGFLENFFPDDRNPIERIITLFFFCSDVIISTIKKKINQYALKFLKWSLSFIAQRVCAWVSIHGGWNRLLGIVTQNFQNALKIIGAATVITGIMAMFLHYFLKGK